MRYKELPKKWKVIAALLMIVNILLIVFFIGFGIFLHAYRKNCAELRAPLKKDDSLLIGEHLYIKRDGADDIDVNLYIPDNLDITIHNLGKITPSVTPAACHLPQRGRRIMAPSLRGLSA